MDLRNLETTSTLAIEAVYKEYWSMIPEKYRIYERPQREDKPFPPEFYDRPNIQKSTPLSYKQVEEKGKPKEPEQENDYEWYCNCLNNKDKFFDLQPFFDPQLDFENRLHYKLVGVNYPDRRGPWFVITWNCGNGILKSDLTNRRLDTATVITPSGEKVKFDFIDTTMDLTLCFTSNNMQALFELQENIRINRREKCTVETRPHSILGKFNVILSLIDVGNITKMSKDKGSLCTLTVTFKLEYNVIGNVKLVNDIGIIERINMELDKPNGEGPDNHEVLARDIITEKDL